VKVGDIYTSGNWLSFERAEEEKLFDKTLTIKQAVVEDVKAGERKIVLSYEETEKQLVLNKSNANALEELFKKPKYAEWVGEKMQIIRGKALWKGKQVNSMFVAKVPEIKVEQENVV